jgi:hypothetical protein
MPVAHQQKWKEKGVRVFSSVPIKTLLKHFQVLREVDPENKGVVTKETNPNPTSVLAEMAEAKTTGNRERNNTIKREKDNGKMKNPCEYHNGAMFISPARPKAKRSPLSRKSLVQPTTMTPTWIDKIQDPQ